MSPALPAAQRPGQGAGQGAEPAPEPRDLRTVALGSAGWAGGLAALHGGPALAAAGGVAAVVLLGVLVPPLRRRFRSLPWLAGACLLAFAAVAGAAAVSAELRRTGPVARLAEEQASVRMVARVTSDPRLREGRYGPFVVVRLRARAVDGLGRSYAVDVPVLLLGGPGWTRARLGDQVEVAGRLRPAPEGGRADVAAVVLPRGDPVVQSRPGPLLDAAEAVRAGIRAATARGSPDAQALVPALVVGDDRQMAPGLVEDFRATGLTHLAAVSGTNLTLVVGALLVAARAVGVRARGLTLVGLLGVAGFVLLARTEPSVVRAAAMGSIALVGMGTHGRQHGIRALGAAVLLLLLLDPWLAVSWGFALSVVATGGILFWAPGLRDAMTRWLPRWAAEAVAVPLTAQLACTPLIAALSDQVSLVAVAANLLVSPAVAPATVLGLLGGLVHLAVPVLGAAVGWAAVACGWWIVAVATRLARLPGAAVEWTSDPFGLAVLAVVSLVLVAGSRRLLAAPVPAGAAALVLAVVVAVPLPTPGWPPRGWVMVACDVGQGDAIVLAAGRGRAVVVDAGPEPALVDRCLRRLRVETVPAVVLTHFHADHVDGLPGVLGGRRVGEVVVTGLADPPEGAAAVARWAAAAGVPVRVAAFGERRVEPGGLGWQVVGPARTTGRPGDGAAANDASLVLLVQARGVRILAGGDMEAPAQQMLRRTHPGLQADVLKVPHHGSVDQDPALLLGLGARLAVVPVGADNGYGHPAPATLALLERAGMLVRRTDLHGDVAVVVRDGDLAVVTRK